MRQNPYRKGSNRVVGDVSLAAVQGEGIIRDRSVRYRTSVPSVSSSRFSNRLNISRKPPRLAIASPQRPPIRFFREGGNLCAAGSFGFFYQAAIAMNRSCMRGNRAAKPGGMRGLGGCGKNVVLPEDPRSKSAESMPVTPVVAGRVRRSSSWWWFRRCEPPGIHSARSPLRSGRDSGRRGLDRHR